MRKGPLVFAMLIILVGAGLSLFLISANNPKVSENSADLIVNQEPKNNDDDLVTLPNNTDVAPTPVFVDADAVSASKLQPWFDDVFMADFSVPEVVLRRNFLKLNVDHLREELTRSLAASQSVSTENQASVTLNIFQDVEYAIVVNSYRLGSSGDLNFGAEIVGATNLGREYFEFFIAPDGEVVGTGVTIGRIYSFTSTPDPNVLLAIEIDGKLAGDAATFD